MNVVYYIYDVLEIFDVDYDWLKWCNIVFEVVFFVLKCNDSLSDKVGVLVVLGFFKIDYVVLMLFLGNVFSDEDVVDFDGCICSFLGFIVDVLLKFIVEFKIDGFSLLLWYEGGKLI